MNAEQKTSKNIESAKKLYFSFSDGVDVSGIILDLSGCMGWIEGEGLTEEEDMKQYTLTPVWLTDEEFENLPEADI